MKLELTQSQVETVLRALADLSADMTMSASECKGYLRDYYIRKGVEYDLVYSAIRCQISPQ